VYKFCKKLKLKESDFFDKYSSFEILEQKIWQSFMKETTAALYADEGFQSYPIREKVLAYYFTHIEVLRKNRSYILATSKDAINPLEVHQKLKKYKSKFDEFFKEVIDEGISTNQLVSQKLLSSQFHWVFWIQNLYLIRFWIKDESPGFEKTDAAIEKSSTLIFNLLSHGSVDKLLDFGKFLMQNQ